mgnify:CR=1 FL=1
MVNQIVMLLLLYLVMIGALIFEVLILWAFFEELMSDNKCLTLLSLGSTCANMFLLLWMVGTFTPLYLSDSAPFLNTETFNMSSDLLTCASDRMPHLGGHFLAIQECLTHVDMYRVRNGRLPYLRHSIPQAFVLSFDDNSVFVSSRFLSLSLIDRALVMIHECAHIGLGAKDYAYIWEDHYEKLTPEQHLGNADSFMHIVLKYCTN